MPPQCKKTCVFACATVGLRLRLQLTSSAGLSAYVGGVVFSLPLSRVFVIELLWLTNLEAFLRLNRRILQLATYQLGWDLGTAPVTDSRQENNYR